MIDPKSYVAGLFDLTGHVGIVTGASRGLGMGQAKVLTDAGATVSVSTWLASFPQTRDAVILELSSSHTYVGSLQAWPVAGISSVTICVSKLVLVKTAV